LGFFLLFTLTAWWPRPWIIDQQPKRMSLKANPNQSINPSLSFFYFYGDGWKRINLDYMFLLRVIKGFSLRRSAWYDSVKYNKIIQDGRVCKSFSGRIGNALEMSRREKEPNPNWFANLCVYLNNKNFNFLD
jgi:hypothetical protein